MATLEIEIKIGWRLDSFEKNFNVQRDFKGEGAISLVTIELSLSVRNLENISRKPIPR